MSVNLATPGDLQFDIGSDGEVADLSNAVINGQRVNESATSIEFGRAVAIGTTSAMGPSCKPVGSANDIVAGLAVKAPTMPADYSTNIAHYVQYKNVPILEDGPMFVTPVENWADGDAVYAIVNQAGKLGSASGGGASANRLLVRGARFFGAGTANTKGKVIVRAGSNITLGT